VVFNDTAGPGGGPAAPKRLELIVSHVARGKAVLWASCWPQGEHLAAVSQHIQHCAQCLLVLQPALPRVANSGSALSAYKLGHTAQVAHHGSC